MQPNFLFLLDSSKYNKHELYRTNAGHLKAHRGLHNKKYQLFIVALYEFVFSWITNYIHMNDLTLREIVNEWNSMIYQAINIWNENDVSN